MLAILACGEAFGSVEARHIAPLIAEVLLGFGVQCQRGHWRS